MLVRFANVNISPRSNLRARRDESSRCALSDAPRDACPRLHHLHSYLSLWPSSPDVKTCETSFEMVRGLSQVLGRRMLPSICILNTKHRRRILQNAAAHPNLRFLLYLGSDG
eukprot:6244180-Amphidinium_carterae.3